MTNTLLHRSRGIPIQELGHWSAPCERDFVDCVIGTHLFPDLAHIGLSRHNIDDPWRNASAVCKLKRHLSTSVNKIEADHTSTRARAEKGVSGGGFTTAVQPAARAAPSFRVIIAEGKFQGVRIELHPSI